MCMYIFHNSNTNLTLGALKSVLAGGDRVLWVSDDGWRKSYLGFDANGGASTDNLMAGHAVATDSDGGIRPYNISMIPIIIVS